MRRGKWSVATTCITTAWWRLSSSLLLLSTCLSHLHTSKWNWNWTDLSINIDKCLMDLELHCDSFLFLAQCMRYTIPFHNIKVFILSGEFYVMCIINVFHGCWCDNFSWQFQTPEMLTLLLFQLGPELWPWRAWTADGHIGKVASQKTVKFFLYWLICTDFCILLCHKYIILIVF